MRSVPGILNDFMLRQPNSSEFDGALGSLWTCDNRPAYSESMDRRRVHRCFDLIIGIPVLLLGVCAMAIDVLTSIGAAGNADPNTHPITTFPGGTVLGIPLYWLGFRLVFRAPWLLLMHRMLMSRAGKKEA